MDKGPSTPPGLGHQKRPRVSEENRKRAVRACDGCRRVKEKCEGGVPCRRCLRYRRQCVFTHPEHAEKLARSSSVSILERTAARSRHDMLESERIRYMECILQHYVPNISFDIQSLRKTAEELKNKHRGSESEGRPSIQLDSEDLEDLAIEDEDFTIKALPDNTTRMFSALLLWFFLTSFNPPEHYCRERESDESLEYSGEFSYLNFSMKIRKKIDEWMKAATPEASTEAEPYEERWRATQLQSGSAVVSASVTCLPPRFVADFLVQIFFKYAQTNNFYVEEDWLREKLNTCYTNPGSLSCNDAGSVCAILMVLAIGTQFAHMESAPPVNRLSVNSSNPDDHGFSEDEVGLTFYQFASKLVPDIIAAASIRSVQACLLIGTYLLPLDTSGLCYTYLGLALKMAIQNGMHRKYCGEGLPAHVIEVRNRVFWTAYTIEKRVSILHGRPVSLSETDVDAALPVDFPGLMPSGQVSNHTNMVALITLTLKLGEVVNEISVLRRSRKGQQQDCLERFLNLRKHLVDWWTTLPEETVCRDLNPAGPLFRPNVHLKLDYCLTRIFLGRPFLFSTMKGFSLPTTFQGSPFKTPSGVSKNRSTLVTDCVEAALEIVDICRLLRDETGLARASFTEFSSCRAALLVILAQSLTKRTERLREALQKGMALIKIMSMGVGSARSAVSVIEALERAISRLEECSESQASGHSGSIESAYDRFKNWEMLWKTGPISPQTHTFPEQFPPGVNGMQPVSLTSAAAAATAAATTTTTATTGPSNGHDQMETTVLPNGNTSTSPDFLMSHTLSQMPHIGYDQFVSTLPQELGEFTAIPCFEADPQNLSGDIKPDTGWMQFMSE
ncbi:putative C6 transcription factor (PrnA) [Aspergillus ochraceoroseus]|uniref:Putative C6 transcription factor (PrnA) n=1 Tax=Aspergillus ochraceoroseus TaxID=138278 RepID=A0A0F8XES7_9EURO|nr:putative C6 transcription factor (PrnA) [Aspergillus ochraceoroseus]